MARVGLQRHREKLYITLFRAQPEDGTIYIYKRSRNVFLLKLSNYILIVIT